MDDSDDEFVADSDDEFVAIYAIVLVAIIAVYDTLSDESTQSTQSALTTTAYSPKTTPTSSTRPHNNNSVDALRYNWCAVIHYFHAATTDTIAIPWYF